jgi:hypothetical protein
LVLYDQIQAFYNLLFLLVIFIIQRGAFCFIPQAGLSALARPATTSAALSAATTAAKAAATTAAASAAAPSARAHAYAASLASCGTGLVGQAIVASFDTQSPAFYQGVADHTAGLGQDAGESRP